MGEGIIVFSLWYLAIAYNYLMNNGKPKKPTAFPCDSEEVKNINSADELTEHNLEDTNQKSIEDLYVTAQESEKTASPTPSDRKVDEDKTGSSKLSLDIVTSEDEKNNLEDKRQDSIEDIFFNTQDSEKISSPVVAISSEPISQKSMSTKNEVPPERQISPETTTSPKKSMSPETATSPEKSMSLVSPMSPKSPMSPESPTSPAEPMSP